MTEHLLLDSYPIPVLPELAQIIGLNEAIVLQQVHYWCRMNKREGRNLRNGYYWVYNSYRNWTEQNFPWWSERTVKTTFSKLEKQGLLISGNFNKAGMDRTKWYRINYPALASTISTSPLGKSCTMDWAGISQPIPEINTDTNKGRREQGSFPSCPADSPEENPGSNSIPIVEGQNKELSGFIDWYFRLYLDTYGVDHPNIKSQQRIRVTNTLEAFINENDLDIDALQEMAYAFFENVDSDHNINHFATPGILENRYYEAVY